MSDTYVSSADTKVLSDPRGRESVSSQSRVEHKASFRRWLNLLSRGDQRTEAWLQSSLPGSEAGNVLFSLLLSRVPGLLEALGERGTGGRCPML